MTAPGKLTLGEACRRYTESQNNAEISARLAAETIAAQQAELRRLESALHKAEHEHAKAVAVLRDCEEYLDQRADVLDGPDGHPRPDAAMSLLNEVRRLLGRHE